MTDCQCSNSGYQESLTPFDGSSSTGMAHWPRELPVRGRADLNLWAPQGRIDRRAWLGGGPPRSARASVPRGRSGTRFPSALHDRLLDFPLPRPALSDILRTTLTRFRRGLLTSAPVGSAELLEEPFHHDRIVAIVSSGHARARAGRVCCRVDPVGGPDVTPARALAG